jgi:protein mago nashi
LLRYANSSSYKGEKINRKAVYLSPSTISVLQNIVARSDIMQQDDKLWPEANESGKQELEIVYNREHISFVTSKLTSSLDIQSSQDSTGLRKYYNLLHDIRVFASSLIKLHFNVKPF